jgi:hypothetical protein
MLFAKLPSFLKENKMLRKFFMWGDTADKKSLIHSPLFVQVIQ